MIRWLDWVGIANTHWMADPEKGVVVRCFILILRPWISLRILTIQYTQMVVFTQM